jgi:hypothetical protein
MNKKANKKNIAGRFLVAGFFVLVTFFSLQNATPVQAVTGDYNKAATSTLTAFEWNNLISDFISNAGGRINGSLGINTATSTYALDINGLANFTQPVIVGTPTGATHATTKSYVDSLIAGGAGSTVGYWSMNGANINNSNAGNVGIGTTNPVGSLQIVGASVGVGIAPLVVQNTNAYASPYTQYSQVWLNATGGVLASLRNDGDLTVTNHTNSNYFVAKITGSVSNPAFMGAGGLGIYFPSSAIGLVTNSLERVRIDSSGNVGIGLTNPVYKLDVVGSGQFTQPVIVGTPTLATHAVTKSYVDSLMSSSVGVGTSGQTLRNNGTGWVADSNLFNTGTNVGIGITTPLAKLHVYDTTSLSSLALFRNNTDYGSVEIKTIEADAPLIKSGADDSLNFSTNNSDVPNLSISSVGNIGIGVSSPSLAKLQIAGSIFATGLDDVFIALDDQSLPRFGMVKKSGYAGMFAHSNNSLFTIGMTNANTINPTGFTALTSQLVIDTAGNVGISLGSPTYKLDVNGTSRFNQPVVVGTPTGATHATTKSYVDSLLTGGSGSAVGYWTMNGTNINNNNSGNVGIGTTNPLSKLQVIGGMISSPDSGANSERFGLNSQADGTYANAFGNNTNVTGSYSSGFGADVTVTGNYSTAFGSQTTLHGDDSLVLGEASTVGATAHDISRSIAMGTDNYIFNSNVVALGGAISTTHPNTFLVGTGVFSTAANQVVIGANGYPKTDVFFGNGVTNASPSAYTIHGTSGSGSDIAGANVQLAAGQGTGTGVGGSILFQTADAGLTGSSLNPLVTRATINSAGNVGVNITNPVYKLDVAGTGQFNQPVIVGTPTGATHATTKSYVDSLLTGGSGSTVGYWTMNGTNISNSNSGNVGIGTTNPVGSLQIVGASVGVGIAPLVVQNTNAYASPYTQYSQVWLNATGGVLASLRNDGDLTVTNHTNSNYFVAKITGSVSNPAFMGAGGLGIYFPSSAIGLVTNSLERVRIDSSGNVGIGTTTPVYKLDVAGTGQFTQPVIVGTPTGATHAVTKSYVDSLLSSAVGAGTTGQTLRNDGTGWVANSTLFNTGTNIGIGITNPGAKMHIGLSSSDSTTAPTTITRANEYLHIGKQEYNTNSYRLIGFGYTQNTTTSSPAYIGFQETNTGGETIGDLIFGTRSVTSDTPPTERLRIASSGNIGIGTTAPNQLLVVTGATSTIKISDITAVRQPQLELVRGTIDTFGADGYTDWRMYIAGGDLRFLRQDNGGNSGDAITFGALGNLGIGLTNPVYKLDVAGTGQFTQPVIVGTPTGATHATTKSYVDSLLTGGSGSAVGYWTMNGTNINNNNSGNVGIGTTNPNSLLEIAGASGSQINIRSTAGLATDNTFLQVGNGRGNMGYDGVFGGIRIATSDASKPIVFANSLTAGTSEVMRIAGGGNVGIGTTNPIAQLDIAGSTTAGALIFSVGGNDLAGDAMRVTSTGPSGTTYTAGSSAVLNVGGRGTTPSIRTRGGAIFSETYGNVGIGLTNPVYKLDVAGTGQFTQPVIVGTPTGATHATTKSYVDSLLTGGSGSAVGYWTMNGTNINNNNSGNVGVGNTNPAYKLDISGSFSATASSSSIMLDANGNVSIGI